ncbi:meiosis-specific nuclear structural protein 1 [Drosophila grimshawi]|uniref:Meiosis-specific nuclear structural protein 1 n=1 Tax=Drosophila grimshawi TaxID=7222 RepID=B4JV56_DROGR|nr:meiosis-specific nuclear structural protein 1 [Drosophila grimshawi]EDV91376.1 GH14366 [Drosophila grimshawi]
MTAVIRRYMEARDATPAIHITGRPKFNVEVDEKFMYQRAKYYCATTNEMDLRSTEMSKDNSLRQRAAFVEETMSDELKKLKHKEFIDRKRRQQLRNDCEELREIAEQLRLAAITKDLDDSIVEMNKHRQLAKNAQMLEFQRVEAERQQQLASQVEQELHKKEQQKELLASLSTQIEETRNRRQQQYVQSLTEREELIAMQRQIEEEDRLQQLELERQKQKKRNDMIKLIEQQREYKELQRAQSNEDIAKVLQNQSEMLEQQDRIDQARLAAQRKQEQISLRIGQQVFEIEDRKRQRDNLLLDLLQAEYKAKDDERYRQQLEQEQLERRRAREELERYRAEVAERDMEQARLKLANAVHQNVDCTTMQEIKERELQERLRRKEHGALLLSMIEENHRKRADAAAENMKFFETKAKSEAELQQRIREERLEMLGSVPPSVLKYLPKHVLSESDRKYFNIDNKTVSATAKGQQRFK